jgi:alpha-beta hydrolase superfamily lysophospholipase
MIRSPGHHEVSGDDTGQILMPTTMGPQVVLTGHSLGGAVASIAALQLKVRPSSSPGSCIPTHMIQSWSLSPWALVTSDALPS